MVLLANYLVIFLVGILGLMGGGWWVIPLGALGLSIGPWLHQWKMLRDQPWVRIDQQIVGFFAVSFGNSLIACSASYLVGVVGHALLSV